MEIQKSLSKSILNHTRLVLFILPLIFINSIKSQDNPSFVGLSSGISIPFEKFRSINLDDGSFALIGLNITAEGAWFFMPELGFGASVGMNLNPVDVSSLGWAKVVQDPNLQNVTIRSEPYRTLLGMAGAYTHLPIYKNFTFNGKLLGGLLFGQTPYQLYKPQYLQGGPAYYEITAAQDWKFSWQAGAGIQYDVSPCVGLVIDAVIMYDKLYFNFNTASGIRTDIHTIALINTTMGIRIKL